MTQQFKNKGGQTHKGGMSNGLGVVVWLQITQQFEDEGLKAQDEHNKKGLANGRSLAKMGVVARGQR